MKTMKSTMARLFALCLTVAMVLSVATMGAFAAPITKVDQEGTITINSAASDKDAEVDLYKIMKVNLVNANGTVQPKDPMYTWVDAVANWLKTNTDETYKGYINADNNNAVTDSFKNATAAQLSKFISDLKTAITKLVQPENPEEEAKPVLELKAAYHVTLSNTVEKIENVEMGYYLVVANKSAYVYSPATVTLAPVWDEGSKAWVLNDASVTVKGKGGIEKTVTGGDLQYAVGDTVNYRLDVVIPTYPEGATATAFDVGDKMSHGLTWDKKVAVYWSENGIMHTKKEGEGDDQKEVPDTKYLVDASNYALATPETDEDLEKDITFEVQFNYDELTTDYPRAKYVHVVYTAILNEDAFTTDSLGNDAYLGVNTDPYDGGSYETTDTHEQVYTYGINVTKVDANNHATTLAGAKFTLKNADGTEIQFVETGDGVYVKYAAANYEPGEDITPVTTLVTDTNGTLQLKGLDIGTYTLTETKAPGGYQLPASPVTTITLTDSEPDGVLDDGTTTATGTTIVGEVKASGNTVNFQIGNTKPGFELPTTGGMGTVLFTAGGLVIMACGAALVLVTLKKKKAED